MGERVRIAVAGMQLDINDVDEEFREQGISLPTVTAPVIPISVGKRTGRSRFHSVCPLHGASDTGESCAKFSHLPGKGRGPQQPGAFRMLRVIARAAAKPFILLAFVGIVGYFALGAVGNVLNGGFLNDIGTVPVTEPGTGTEPVPNVNTPNGGTIPGQNSGSVGSGPQSDCFVPGNPCGLVIPQPVK